jgi:hypothetical protein
MNAAVPIGVVAIGALLVFAMGQQQPGSETTIAAAPPSVLDRVIAAVQSNDPAVMRAEATRLEADGYPVQANDLRRSADVLAIAIAMQPPSITLPRATNTTKKPGNTKVEGDALHAPSSPQPYSPLPGILPPMMAKPEIDPLRLQAQALINNLEKYPRGKEDCALVADFQKRNGLKASGNYNPSTAATLAVKYGLVPPAPYWPKRGRVEAKEKYRALLNGIADRDPQRAEEFRRAARV